MANVKISELTALTNPSWSEEFIFAKNWTNGKVTLDTLKIYVLPSGGVYNYKWSVADYDHLPTSWQSNWDVYNVESDFTISWTTYPAWTNVAWNGSARDPLAWAAVDNTAYWSSWDWDTIHAPSKNAVYDKINAMDTTIWNKANSSDVLAKDNTTAYTPSTNYHPATKKYVDDNAVTFKPFPAGFVTNSTTTAFLSSITALSLPSGMAYLWQVSLNDMPDWVTVQAEVEVYIYPQNVAYCVMRSSEVAPYVWEVNSYENRWREPLSNQYTWATAPDYPTEWMLWFDTTEKKLKVYDGTQWKETWSWWGWNFDPDWTYPNLHAWLANDLYSSDEPVDNSIWNFRTSAWSESIPSSWKASLNKLMWGSIYEKWNDPVVSVEPSSSSIQIININPYKFEAVGWTAPMTFTLTSGSWDTDPAIYWIDVEIEQWTTSWSISVTWFTAHTAWTFTAANPASLMATWVNQFDISHVNPGWSIDLQTATINASTWAIEMWMNLVYFVKAAGWVNNWYMAYDPDWHIVNIWYSETLPDIWTILDMTWAIVTSTSASMPFANDWYFVVEVDSTPTDLSIHPKRSWQQDTNTDAYSESSVVLPTTDTSSNPLPTILSALWEVQDEIDYRTHTWTQRIWVSTSNILDIAAECYSSWREFVISSTSIMYVLASENSYTFAWSWEYIANDYWTERLLDSNWDIIPVTLHVITSYWTNLVDKLRTWVVAYSDFEWDTITSNSITKFRWSVSINANATLSVWSNLKPWFDYVIKVTNTDTVNAHVLTISWVWYAIPKETTFYLTFVAINSNTLDFVYGWYKMAVVNSLPATIDNGTIYFSLSDADSWSWVMNSLSPLFAPVTDTASTSALEINNLTTIFEPTQDFTLSAWTVIPWMSYVLRLSSGITAYNITLDSSVTNPYGESLTLTAGKVTTIVLLAVSNSDLEIMSVRTAQ